MRKRPAAAPAPTPSAKPPIIDDRTIMKMAPSRMKIPAIKDTTKPAVGFSLTADPLPILRVVSKSHYKSIAQPGGGNDLFATTPFIRGYLLKGVVAKRSF